MTSDEWTPSASAWWQAASTADRLRDLVSELSGAEVAMAAAAVFAIVMMAASADMRSSSGAKTQQRDRGQTEVFRGPRA